MVETMKKLNFELKKLCEHNRDGSYNTQAERHKILQGMAKQLVKLGYTGMRATSLKPKHIDALITYYQAKELATGTIKNRLSVIRWWAEKIGKAGIVKTDNAEYGIPSRIYVTNESKACNLPEQKLADIRCPNLQMSLELQAAFGLRREECIKFMPNYADRGSYIQLKDTWCKGGKARAIPIIKDEQREVLNRAHALVGKASLIPANKTYVKQMRLYERETRRAGLSRLHGLRHRYAQQRYEALTGWRSPACGGPTTKALTEQQRLQDFAARTTISQELGHFRIQIVAVYIGS
jgi:site-specific recombinase XerC